MSSTWLAPCILLIFLVRVRSESDCGEFLTCGDCITYPSDNCAWCSAKDHTGKRCQSRTNVNGDWCSEQPYDPQPEVQISQNEPFHFSYDLTRTIQLRPQKIRVKLRPGKPVTFPLSYKPAKDYPLDIYYLIDASFTMRLHKEKLREQGMEIYKALTKLNNNVRLGMGSFIEKPGMPFSYKRNNNSAKNSYAYKNNLKLTTDMSDFTKAVSNIQIIGNLDDPEAGLDGLMQSIVCKEQVGWREEARRIIVYSTDETYHSAGDGKFGAAYRPNDMKCHLTGDTYVDSLDYDYPSVSQINRVAMDNNIKVILTIVGRAIHEYKPLASSIHGANVIPLNSNDVVGMIIKEYNELVRNVLVESELPPHMRLIAEPDCTEKNKLCNINKKNSLDMNITLIVDQCTNKRREEVKIGINSLKQKLVIDVEIDCECDCEREGEENSSVCNGAGTYQCGVCACNENRYGSTCRCSGTENSSAGDKDKCTFKNDTQMCSGRGTCRCGNCEDCRAGFSGEWCEFDDGSCARPGGQLCGGHGRCRFASCQCDAGWAAPDCHCPDNDRACVAPYSKEVCSGNGVCVCGQCQCVQNEDGCSGRYCERCKSGNPKACKHVEDFVVCNALHGLDECLKKHSEFQDCVLITKHRDEFNSNEYVNAVSCKKSLENGTDVVYKYDPSATPPVIVLQIELDSPSKVVLWIVVGTAIGLVLLIGFLTVIAWKILIELHDAREYHKFESAAKSDGFNVSHQNPLYMSPVVDVRNPAYESADYEYVP